MDWIEKDFSSFGVEVEEEMLEIRTRVVSTIMMVKVTKNDIV